MAWARAPQRCAAPAARGGGGRRARFARAAVRAGGDDGEDKAPTRGSYPSRDAMSGGWAGGERGVRQFVDRGENVRERDPRSGVEVMLSADGPVAAVVVALALVATCGAIGYVTAQFAAGPSY